MAQVSRQKGCMATQLPEEIWQRIAGCMRTREWAQVSLTCKVMHAVQPRSMDIYRPSTGSLAWLSRRWGGASQISISLGEAIPPNVVSVMSRDAARLANSERLNLFLRDFFSPSLAMWCGWLLAHCHGLKRLELFLYWLNTPLNGRPLPNLRQLEITQACPQAVFDISLMAHLTYLDTLLLGSDLKSAADETACQALKKLTSFCIKDAAKGRLDLPRGCQLHLTITEVPQTGPNDSEDVLSPAAETGLLRSVRITTSKALEELPAFMLAQRTCTCLQWATKNIGGRDFPVAFTAPAFCSLESLYLQADSNIFVTISGSVTPRVLHVCGGILNMQIEEPQSLALSLREFSVYYKKLQGAAS